MNKTLVLGLEQFIDKIGYQAKIYSDNGVEVKYLVNDKNGNSLYFSEKYNANIKVLPYSRVAAIFTVIYELTHYGAKDVEVYDTGGMFLAYVILSWLLRKRVFVILRGQELQRHKRSKLSFNYLKHYIGTKISKRYIIKETNIVEEYVANGFDESKIFKIHNAIPMPNDCADNSERTIDILYLNSVRKGRKVKFLISVFDELVKKRPEIKIVMAGFNSLDRRDNSFDLSQEQEVIESIEHGGLENNVEIKGFVRDSRLYHAKAKIFVFPADIIFLNYSLLESMSYGCVPVVSDGEGADKIVNDYNGFVLPLDVSVWVDSIEKLLGDDKLWNDKSMHSLNTVKTEFSIDNWFCKMRAAKGPC